MPVLSEERAVWSAPESRPIVSHLCTAALNRLEDLIWELRLGIHTRGGKPTRYEDGHAYGYLAYNTYFAVLDRLDLGAEDELVDLGAGKGRVVCAAAQYRIRRAIGVEIDAGLWATARSNAARLRRRQAPLHFECSSAIDFNFDPITVIVMFHPFGAETLRRVLERVGKSLARRPRNLRIAYLNPIHRSVLLAQPWLRSYDHWQPGPWSRIKFSVDFFRAA